MKSMNAFSGFLMWDWYVRHVADEDVDWDAEEGDVATVTGAEARWCDCRAWLQWLSADDEWWWWCFDTNADGCLLPEHLQQTLACSIYIRLQVLQHYAALVYYTVFRKKVLHLFLYIWAQNISMVLVRKINSAELIRRSVGDWHELLTCSEVLCSPYNTEKLKSTERTHEYICYTKILTIAGKCTSDLLICHAQYM